MKLLAPITDIKGIGEKRAAIFAQLGITNIGGLLYYFPRTYMDYPQINNYPDELDGKMMALSGRLLKRPINRHARNILITTAYLLAGNLQVDLVWFNSAHIMKMVDPYKEYVYYGRLKESKGKLKMEQPLIYTKEKYDELVGAPQPIYPLVKGLKNSTIVSAIKQAFSDLSPEIFGDYLEKEYMLSENLDSIYQSLYNMHFPESRESLKLARRRLVFDEFFFFFYDMKKNKEQEELIPNTFDFIEDKESRRVRQLLPFELTKGQSQTVEDIIKDLKSDNVTQRLIQGDVGSGKTIIAFLAMLLCVENGYKAAIMAPTEVLARQHYNTFQKFKEDFKINFADTVLLTGKLTAKEKREIKERLNKIEPLFIVGTHAVIQKDVEIKDLALAIIDEQHRFGVKQRKELSLKGINPFYLVMSATPIPRSLAKILYGNMNISVIEGLPKSRLPIKNCVIKDDLRQNAYNFIKKEVDMGHQAYIICPLVEASEKTEAESVTEYYEKIKHIFPKSIRVGLLHGRMKVEEKNQVMTEFSAGNLDILISTTVVEVGIDVPNATVIMIENANRFGLAQLHQLRGRVGRGDSQSYCIFMNDKNEDSERLKVINSSNDGFFIANEDLRLRGPGELNGLRQSGDLGFRLGDIYTDRDILSLAQSKVEEYIYDSSLQESTHLYQQLHSWNSWYNI